MLDQMFVHIILHNKYWYLVMLSGEMSIFADENTNSSGVSRNIVSEELSIKASFITQTLGDNDCEYLKSEQIFVTAHKN